MKKIVITTLMTLTIGASFYIGRVTAEPKEVIVKDLEIVTVTEPVKEKVKEDIEEDNYNIIDVGDIIDWNTNGEEISLITKDDYEYYAYKTENIYEDLRYYNIKEVDTWEIVDNTLKITFADGNIYEWN